MYFTDFQLEYTIAQQQAEVRGLKDKLSSHDSAAKRAIAALQNEMKLRIDQVLFCSLHYMLYTQIFTVKCIFDINMHSCTCTNACTHPPTHKLKDLFLLLACQEEL